MLRGGRGTEWTIALIAAALVLLVSSCASGPRVTVTACEAFRPIRPTLADLDVISDSLAVQLAAHNETGAELCRWRP